MSDLTLARAKYMSGNIPDPVKARYNKSFTAYKTSKTARASKGLDFSLPYLGFSKHTTPRDEVDISDHTLKKKPKQKQIAGAYGVKLGEKTNHQRGKQAYGHISSRINAGQKRSQKSSGNSEKEETTENNTEDIAEPGEEKEKDDITWSQQVEALDDSHDGVHEANDDETAVETKSEGNAEEEEEEEEKEVKEEPVDEELQARVQGVMTVFLSPDCHLMDKCPTTTILRNPDINRLVSMSKGDLAQCVRSLEYLNNKGESFTSFAKLVDRIRRIQDNKQFKKHCVKTMREAAEKKEAIELYAQAEEVPLGEGEGLFDD